MLFKTGFDCIMVVCFVTEDENGEVNLAEVSVLYMRQLMYYPIYKMISRGANQDEDEVKQYAGFVGKKCANSILLFRK